MRRTVVLASGVTLLAAILGMAFVFGSAVAQPLWPRGAAQSAATDVASCHSENGAADHMLGVVAKALGTDESSLRVELESGKSIREIAKARGLDDVTLAAALKVAIQETMQRHVQDGTLSQAAVDQMLSQMDAMSADHFADVLDGQMPHDMMDGEDHGGMMGGPQGGTMGGFDHGGMMGGSNHGGMMDRLAPDGDADSGESCHVEDGTAGQRL